MNAIDRYNLYVQEYKDLYVFQLWFYEYISMNILLKKMYSNKKCIFRILITLKFKFKCFRYWLLLIYDKKNKGLN